MPQQIFSCEGKVCVLEKLHPTEKQFFYLCCCELCQFHLGSQNWQEEGEPCSHLTAANSTSTVNKPKSLCSKLAETGGQNERQNPTHIVKSH